MELFRPDNHADREPAYSPPSDLLQARAEALLERHYPRVFRQQNTIRVIGKINTNSLNFKIGPYYFKIIEPKAGIDYVNFFPMLAHRLLESGIPTGRFLPNEQGEMISFDGEFSYLQEFIDGQFYSGSPAEFDESLGLLKKLRESLSGIVPTHGQTEPFRSWNSAEIVVRVRESLSRFNKDEKSPFDIAAEKALTAIGDQPSGFTASLQAAELHHIDLHPHNLLFKSHVLAALLDLESFRAIPSELAEGFALFKLGRKSIASGHLSLASFKKATNDSFDLRRLKPFVKVELERRILLVLKLHYLEANSSWDGDLGKHLAGLKELDLMF